MAAVGKLGSSHLIDSDTNVTVEKITKKQGTIVACFRITGY